MAVEENDQPELASPGSFDLDGTGAEKASEEYSSEAANVDGISVPPLDVSPTEGLNQEAGEDIPDQGADSLLDADAKDAPDDDSDDSNDSL